MEVAITLPPVKAMRQGRKQGARHNELVEGEHWQRSEEKRLAVATQLATGGEKVW
ncbi:multidrug transporter subunit MdtA [Sesbania bispinosa]|nr:multidrug transporter subunit MdtA [Sesbania bispinosa]